jgi:hypothetical protein
MMGLVHTSVARKERILEVTEVKPKALVLKLEREDAQQVIDFLGEYRAIIGGMGFSDKYEEALRLTNILVRALKK